MLKMCRMRALFTVLLTAAAVAVLASTTMFLTANAAENDENVSQSQIRIVTGDVSMKDYAFKRNVVYVDGFRNQLTDFEKLLYDALYDHLLVKRSMDDLVLDFLPDEYVSAYNENNINIMAICAMEALNIDHQELFWTRNFSTHYTFRNNVCTKIRYSFSEQYPGAYNEINTVFNGVDQAVAAISARRTSTSRYDTAKAIHDYMSDVMTYGGGGSETREAHCVAPMFGGGRIGYYFVCEGYARSYKLLCERFGIPCAYVAGGGHAWNYVQMTDGKWYAVDVTWDDNDRTDPYYTYFLVGKNTKCGNETFGESHHAQTNVYPAGEVNYEYPDGNLASTILAHPVLNDNKYDPATGTEAESFDFYGESAENGRTVRGTVDFKLKYTGNVDDVSMVRIGFDSKNYVNVPIDSTGLVTYTYDTTGLKNGEIYLRASLIKKDGTSFSVSRLVVISNNYFEITNPTGSNPTLSGTVEVCVKNISYHSNSDCSAAVYVDNSYVDKKTFGSDRIVRIYLDTTQYSNGSHTLRVTFTNAYNVTDSRQITFTVKNQAVVESFDFYGESAVNRRVVSGDAVFEWLYTGDVSSVDRVLAYVDDKQVISTFLNESGYCSGTVFTKTFSNSEHQMKVNLCKKNGDILTVARTFIINNNFFEFYNWPGNNPTLSETAQVTVQNVSGLPNSELQVSFYIDGKYCQLVYFGDDSLATWYFDTKTLSNGSHTIKAVLRTRNGVETGKQKTFVVSNSTFTVPAFSFNTLGGSIRLTAPYGLRFGIRLDKNEAFRKTEIVEYGTLIIPAGTLGNNELTLSTPNVRRIKAVNLMEQTSTYIVYTGVLINIPESNFNTVIKGRGYLIYKGSDGKNHVVYSQVAEKSFNGVARSAYDSYSRIQNPTSEQKDVLKKLKAILKY